MFEWTWQSYKPSKFRNYNFLLQFQNNNRQSPNKKQKFNSSETLIDISSTFMIIDISYRDTSDQIPRVLLQNI